MDPFCHYLQSGIVGIIDKAAADRNMCVEDYFSSMSGNGECDEMICLSVASLLFLRQIILFNSECIDLLWRFTEELDSANPLRLGYISRIGQYVSIVPAVNGKSRASLCRRVSRSS